MFVAIYAALRAMPSAQASALMHVHRVAVWNFRRLDLQVVPGGEGGYVTSRELSVAGVTVAQEIACAFKP